MHKTSNLFMQICIKSDLGEGHSCVQEKVTLVFRQMKYCYFIKWKKKHRGNNTHTYNNSFYKKATEENF